MIERKKFGTLKNRQKEAEARKGSGGQTEINISKAGRDVTFFQAKAGKNLVSILPYEVGTSAHPYLKKGEPDYVLDYWVHRGIGPGNVRVLCPAKTYGRPCPICEEMARLRTDGEADDKTIDALKPKRRVLYNVLDHSEESKGVQLFDASHALFEKELLESAQEASDDGEMICFSNPDKGTKIRFRAAEKTIGQAKFLEFKDFAFLEREPVEDALLEEAVDLSALVTELPYEKLEALLFGSGDKDEEPEPAVEEKPVSRKAPEPAPTPTGRARTRIKTGVCPHGGEFGKDADQLDSCAECELWDACVDAADEA